MDANLQLLKFIYPAFLSNNNVRNSLINFIERFNTDLIATFLSIQQDRVGSNECIILNKTIDDVNYEIEYDCLNNKIDLILTNPNNKTTSRLTSILQLKQTYTKNEFYYVPSKLRYKNQKIRYDRIAYFILSETAPFQNYEFTNQDGKLIAEMANGEMSRVLTCGVDKNNKIVKTKYKKYKGTSIMDGLREDNCTVEINIEEIFDDINLYSQDFDNERYVCRSLTRNKFDDLCYEETVTYKCIDKGLYQIIKKDAIGEYEYFGDIVGYQNYFVRKYEPNDKGNYKFNSKKSKEIKITKSQLQKILDNECFVENLFNDKSKE